MSRGLSSRGRGGGRGTAKEDPYAFGGGEDDVLPLAQRIDWRLGAGKKSNDTEYLPDEEKEALQKALEASKETAQKEQFLREAGLPIREGFGDETGMGDGRKNIGIFEDVVSEDEESDDDDDYDPKKLTAGRRGSRFHSSAQSKPPPTATAARRGIAQGASAIPKAKTIPISDRPLTRAKVTAGAKRLPVSDKLDNNNVDEKTDEWPPLSDTKPKPTKSFAQAAGGSSKTLKSLVEELERDLELDNPKALDTAVPDGMRFNPFTCIFEPIPERKPLQTPKPTKPPMEFRLLTPHDFEMDNEGRPLTDPSAKARAWTQHLDEINRKAHERNKTVVTRPAQAITYREEETLGSKGRAYAKGPLCEWLDRSFGGGLNQEQRQWMINHRAYVQEVEAKKLLGDKEKATDESTEED